MSTYPFSLHVFRVSTTWATRVLGDHTINSSSRDYQIHTTDARTPARFTPSLQRRWEAVRRESLRGHTTEYTSTLQNQLLHAVSVQTTVSYVENRSVISDCLFPLDQLPQKLALLKVSLGQDRVSVTPARSPRQPGSSGERMRFIKEETAGSPSV